MIKSTYKKIYYDASRPFSNLIKSRVVPGAPVYGICKNTKKFDYTLNLYFSTADFDVIRVVESELDLLLAAFSTVAPHVKLIQGIGF